MVVSAMIDQTTAEGKALQAMVKVELRNYLGSEYNDDVLPLYIVVMLAHGNHQPLVAENLEAFLGQEKAAAFAGWLFKHLKANPGKYEAPAEEAKQESPAKDPVKQSAEAADEASKKRHREKREKIEWKGETAAKFSKHRDREDRREGKRRRNSDDRDRTERSDKDRTRERERGSRRDYDDHRSRQDERNRERKGERHEPQRSRERDREADAYSRKPEAWEDDRRDGKRPRDRLRTEPATAREAERPGRVSRLVGRLGEATTSPSATSLEPRKETRPSIFDRLGRLPSARDARPDAKPEPEESRSKMRMDSMLPRAEVIQDIREEVAPATTGAPDEVAAELRQIRETLAKMQVEKQRQVSAVVASANARKAVVHNVHFNSTPDILKAHFSGCGAIVSAIIEKDPAGNPRGIAVIEFEDESSRRMALTLSGSMLLGRPVTVYTRESAPTLAAFQPRAPVFAPRAFVPGRGTGRNPGRGPGRGAGRPMLKNNKYVRPHSTANGGAEEGTAASSKIVQT